MIAVLKSSQGCLWEIRHTKPRLSWREIHWKVWSSPVGEDLPRCVHLCLCLSLFLFLSSGGGGGASHPLLYEPSISNLLFCIPIHMLFSILIHMLFSIQGRMWLSRTPGRFSLFWCNRNQITLISMPGSRNRLAQLNEWLPISFSSS